MINNEKPYKNFLLVSNNNVQIPKSFKPAGVNRLEDKRKGN